MNSQLFKLTFSWRICRWLQYRKHLLNIIWKCSTHHWFWTFLLLDTWHIWRQIRKLSFIDHQNNSISNIKGRKPEEKLWRKWSVCSISVSLILTQKKKRKVRKKIGNSDNVTILKSNKEWNAKNNANKSLYKNRHRKQTYGLLKGKGRWWR